MTCQDMMDLMQRSLDSDLSVTEEQALYAHLSGCPGCADLYERLKLLSDELAQLPRVMPPYSIVDSIMPQLEGAGGFGEPGAAVEPAASQHLEPVALELEAYRNKRKGLISWKIVSGVAAAGIVLGIFLTNGVPGRDVKNSAADQMLLSGNTNPSATAAAAAGSSDSAAATAPQTAAAKGSAEPTASAPDTAVADEPAARKGQTPEAQSAPSAEAPTHGKEVSAASHRSETAAGESVRTPGTPAASAGSTASTAQPEIGTAETRQTDRIYGIAAVSEQPGTAADPSATPDPTGAVSQMKASGSPHASLTNPEDSPNSEENSPSGDASITSMADPSVSQDGKYRAALDGDHVIVILEDGSIWYASGYRIEPDDQVVWNGWTPEGVFTYTVTKKDGTAVVRKVLAGEKKEIAGE